MGWRAESTELLFKHRCCDGRRCAGRRFGGCPWGMQGAKLARAAPRCADPSGFSGNSPESFEAFGWSSRDDSRDSCHRRQHE